MSTEPTPIEHMLETFELDILGTMIQKRDRALERANAYIVEAGKFRALSDQAKLSVNKFLSECAAKRSISLDAFEYVQEAGVFREKLEP